MISVIMSAYNEKESELRKSINSIINQTYRDLEIIIVDDNPNNAELKKILDSLTDERIKLVYNERNLGLVNSLNRALKVAAGEYIARMDADDISFPDRLEKQLKYLQEKQLDLVGGWLVLIDDSEEDREIRKYEFPSSVEGINATIRFGSPIPHPTWLGKREVFDTLKGYRNVRYCEDYDFVLRAVHHGFKLGNVPDYVLRYRIRSTSITNSNRNKQLLLSRYIGKNRNRIDDVTEEELNKYINSDKAVVEVKYLDRFDKVRADYSQGKNKLKNALILATNKYFWIRRYEMFMTKLHK